MSSLTYNKPSSVFREVLTVLVYVTSSRKCPSSPAEIYPWMGDTVVNTSGKIHESMYENGNLSLQDMMVFGQNSAL